MMTVEPEKITELVQPDTAVNSSNIDNSSGTFTEKKSNNDAQPTIPDDFEEIVPGLFKKILIRGGGPEIPKGSEANVHYVGTLFPGGEKFDSSRDRDTLFSFSMGKGQVIKGWDEGVATMKLGETCLLICNPEMGYGAAGSPPSIPPNSYLQFEVELLDFSAPANTPEEKIAMALENKTKGNALFSQSKFPEALKFYQKGLEYVNYLWGVDAEEEKKKMNDAKLALLLNLAAAKLRLSMFKGALTDAKNALEIDENNVKALYRMTTAYRNLSEFQLAKEAIEKAISISKDPAFEQELALILRDQQALKKKEQKMYQSMFQN